MNTSSPGCLLCMKKDKHIEALESTLVEQERRHIEYTAITEEMLSGLMKDAGCGQILIERAIGIYRDRFPTEETGEVIELDFGVRNE
jgi:hypothetical protein